MQSTPSIIYIMLRSFVLLFCFGVACTFACLAQPVSEDLPRVTNSLALINVNLTTSAGKAPQRSNVVIRNGVFIAIGPNIPIPVDAYRIQADSLYAYPGFIDAFSYTGIKEEESPSRGPSPNNQGPGPSRPRVDEEGNVPLEDAGITPFLEARSSINPSEKSISNWREQGFTIAHSVPRGRMIPGTGAILVLSGERNDQLIWKEKVSLFSQWAGARGNYPSTVIGMMAKWRELYHNASNNIFHQATYEANATVPRPEYNQAHLALMPVVKKEMPVFFRAPQVKDISRALALQEDLGFDLVIADAEQAWYLKDRIKSASVPIVLSMDLPDDKSESKTEKEKEIKEKPVSVPQADSIKTITGEKPTPDPEKTAFEKRRSESLAEHRSQAATLAQAGIPFSFGTMSVKPGDFSKNLKLMMDHGLTKDQALAALTINPAKLLAIDKHAGTIEAGKMANVVITNKPLFEKGSAIRFMIVEGDLYEYEIKEKKKKSSAEEKDATKAIAGTWSYTIESPDQVRKGSFKFTWDSGLTGKIISDEITSGNDELEGIVLDDDELSFTFDHEINGQLVTLEFDLTIKGDVFEGTVTVGEFGSFPITGQRIAKPE